MSELAPLPLKSLSPEFLKILLTERRKRRGEVLAPVPQGERVINMGSIATIDAQTHEPLLDLKAMCLLASRYFTLVLADQVRNRFALRTALAAALTFLQHNGIVVETNELALFQIALDTFHEEAGLEEFSQFLLEHARPPNPSAVWAKGAHA